MAIWIKKLQRAHNWRLPILYTFLSNDFEYPRIYNVLTGLSHIHYMNLIPCVEKNLFVCTRPSVHHLLYILRGFRWALARDQIAKCIHFYFICQRFHFTAHDLADFVFITGGTKCFRERLEKFFHKCSSYTKRPEGSAMATFLWKILLSRSNLRHGT